MGTEAIFDINAYVVDKMYSKILFIGNNIIIVPKLGKLRAYKYSSIWIYLRSVDDSLCMWKCHSIPSGGGWCLVVCAWIVYWRKLEDQKKMCFSILYVYSIVSEWPMSILHFQQKQQQQQKHQWSNINFCTPIISLLNKTIYGWCPCKSGTVSSSSAPQAARPNPISPIYCAWMDNGFWSEGRHCHLSPLTCMLDVCCDDSMLRSANTVFRCVDNMNHQLHFNLCESPVIHSYTLRLCVVSSVTPYWSLNEYNNI